MIKPDFWTDAKLTECSLSARLLFIGTWTYADDNGNMQMCAKQIKMQIFPGDNICIEPLLNELIKHGFLNPYSVNGELYLNISNFKKHQIINRPSPAKCPEYADNLKLTDYSLSTHSERKGKERKSKTAKPASALYTDAFLSFWNAYPKNIGKLLAAESFAAVVKSYAPEDVTDAAKEYATQCAREKTAEKFIMHPNTFLHKDRWKDYCFEVATNA